MVVGVEKIIRMIEERLPLLLPRSQPPPSLSFVVVVVVLVFDWMIAMVVKEMRRSFDADHHPLWMTRRRRRSRTVKRTTIRVVLVKVVEVPVPRKAECYRDGTPTTTRTTTGSTSSLVELEVADDYMMMIMMMKHHQHYRKW